jgi:hypothetical protein
MLLNKDGSHGLNLSFVTHIFFLDEILGKPDFEIAPFPIHEYAVLSLWLLHYLHTYASLYHLIR